MKIFPKRKKQLTKQSIIVNITCSKHKNISHTQKNKNKNCYKKREIPGEITGEREKEPSGREL